MGVPVHHVMMGAQILQPLSADEELSVAMGMFQLVSEAFESVQVGTDWVARSSFSEEDLPSNVLGFYRAARGLGRPDIKAVCDTWDVQRSQDVFKNYTFGQNRTF